MGSQITKPTNNEEVKSKGWSFQKSSDFETKLKCKEFEDILKKNSMPLKQDSLPDSFFRFDNAQQYIGHFNENPSHNTFRESKLPKQNLQALSDINGFKNLSISSTNSGHSNTYNYLTRNSQVQLDGMDVKVINTLKEVTRAMGKLFVVCDHIVESPISPTHRFTLKKGQTIDYVYQTNKKDWFLIPTQSSPSFIGSTASGLPLEPQNYEKWKLAWIPANVALSLPVDSLTGNDENFGMSDAIGNLLQFEDDPHQQQPPPRKECLRNQLWYHGALPRKTAEFLLASTPESTDGSFIVRESESLPGQYSVSLRYNGRVYHYRINNFKASNETNSNFNSSNHLTSPLPPPPNRCNINKYFIVAENCFENLEELIAHHSNRANGLVYPLLYPLPRGRQTSLVDCLPPPDPVFKTVLSNDHEDDPVTQKHDRLFPPQNNINNNSNDKKSIKSPATREKYEKIRRDLRYLEMDRSSVCLKHKIGSGQYGDVFQAQLNSLDESNRKEKSVAAVKTLKGETMDLTDFLREACIMKELKHPNLVQLLGVCVKNAPYYIITEYVDGGNLLDYLHNLDKIKGDSINNLTTTTSHFIDMAAQIACGMAYLESLNYIHRDLAARNILISRGEINQASFTSSTHNYRDREEASRLKFNGAEADDKIVRADDERSWTSSNNNPLDHYINLELGNVSSGIQLLPTEWQKDKNGKSPPTTTLDSHTVICKVADFGLARKLPDGTEYYNAKVGAKFPIKWTAPEGLSHNKFSTKSDVWAFGILLWEMFTFGSQPYPSIELNQVLQFLERDYRMTKPADCPQTIYSIMLECWKWEPFQRPTFSTLRTQLFSKYGEYGPRGHVLPKQTPKNDEFGNHRHHMFDAKCSSFVSRGERLLTPPGVSPSSFRDRKFSIATRNGVNHFLNYPPPPAPPENSSQLGHSIPDTKLCNARIRAPLFSVTTRTAPQAFLNGAASSGPFLSPNVNIANTNATNNAQQYTVEPPPGHHSSLFFSSNQVQVQQLVPSLPPLIAMEQDEDNDPLHIFDQILAAD